MRITPLDIRKQEFRKAMRGLDADEVYAFLSTVADEYEAVLNDNKALRERLLELDDKVQEYRGVEKTLRDTLITAERVTLEAKENARREAHIIVKEAQIEADRALRDISNEAMRLRSQVQQLRSQREAYLAKMKVVAESHLNYLESAADDFTSDDRSIEDLDVAEPEAPKTISDDKVKNANLFPGTAPPISTPVTPPETAGATPATGSNPASPATPNPDRQETMPRPDNTSGNEPKSAGGTSGFTPRFDVSPTPPPAKPAEQTSPNFPPRATPEAPRTDAAPPSNSFEPASFTPGQGDNGSVSQTLGDLNSIIDRMRQGQREVLEGSSRSLDDDNGPSMGLGMGSKTFAPIPTPATQESPATQTATAVETPVLERPSSPVYPASVDGVPVDRSWHSNADRNGSGSPEDPNAITSELDADEIRRELAERRAIPGGNKQR